MSYSINVVKKNSVNNSVLDESLKKYLCNASVLCALFLGVFTLGPHTWFVCNIWCYINRF